MMPPIHFDDDPDAVWKDTIPPCRWLPIDEDVVVRYLDQEFNFYVYVDLDSVALRLAFSPTLNLLASAGSDGAGILWDVERHSPLRTDIPAHADRISRVGFSHDKQFVATSLSPAVFVAIYAGCEYFF